MTKQIKFMVAGMIGVMLCGQQLHAQLALKTNLISPLMLGTSGEGIGGGDLFLEFAGKPKRTHRVGLEWQMQTLGTRSRFEPGDTTEFKLNTARLGVSYALKWYRKEAAAGAMPSGFFWSVAANASWGHTFERETKPTSKLGNLANHLPRAGAGGGLGYTFMKNRFLLEPAIRVGLASPPAVPPGHYEGKLFSGLDRLIAMVIFTRLELNVGYQIR